jgi:hypothetical protein
MQKIADEKEHLMALYLVGLLFIEPVAKAACPSSSHPTDILTGVALRFEATPVITITIGSHNKDNKEFPKACYRLPTKDGGQRTTGLAVPH